MPLKLLSKCVIDAEDRTPEKPRVHGHVATVTNATQRRMQAEFRDFVCGLKEGCLAFIHFSGHGAGRQELPLSPSMEAPSLALAATTASRARLRRPSARTSPSSGASTSPRDSDPGPGSRVQVGSLPGGPACGSGPGRWRSAVHRDRWHPRDRRLPGRMCTVCTCVCVRPSQPAFRSHGL